MSRCSSGLSIKRLIVTVVIICFTVIRDSRDSGMDKLYCIIKRLLVDVHFLLCNQCKSKVNNWVLFLLQPVTVLILRTTVMLILASAFVPLTLGDQNVNSVKKITGDSLLNLAVRYGRLAGKPWLLTNVRTGLLFWEPQSLFSKCSYAHIKKNKTKQ